MSVVPGAWAGVEDDNFISVRILDDRISSSELVYPGRIIVGSERL